MATTRSIVAAFAVGGLLIGCSGSDTSTSESSPETTPDSTVTAPATDAPTTVGGSTTITLQGTDPTTTDLANTDTTTTTTTTAPTTTNATTTSQPAEPTTTDAVANGFQPPPATQVSVSADIPSGEFIRAPGDLIVLRTDGNLEYRPNALSPGNEAPPIALLDRADPRPRPDVSPGPNIVSDVAGFVDGSVIYGECCEPVSGNVFAVNQPGSDIGPVAVGYLVDQSPDGSGLAIASGRQLSIFDVESGQGNGLLLEQTGDQLFSIVDIEWANDDTLLAIIFDGQDHRIVPYEADTLTASPNQLNLDPTVDYETVRFIGRSSNGHVAVATTIGSGAWDVLYLNPSTLDEDLQLHQTFPPSVSNIEIDATGLGQIWVDATTLYYLGPDQFEARPIGDGILAAWFVETS